MTKDIIKIYVSLSDFVNKVAAKSSRNRFYCETERKSLICIAFYPVNSTLPNISIFRVLIL